MVLAGFGLLIAGVWYWNDYSYWSCVKHYSGSAQSETCASRPRHPHRLLGAGLAVGGATWLVGSLVARRQWVGSD
jgi:hypothetical protein